MENNQKNTPNNQPDQNKQMPEEVLNLEQDPNSFRDPLEEQLAKTSNKQENRNNNSQDNSGQNEGRK